MSAIGLTVMQITYVAQSEWEDPSHEIPSYRFVLDCSSFPSWRGAVADTNGNSGG